MTDFENWKCFFEVTLEGKRQAQELEVQCDPLASYWAWEGRGHGSRTNSGLVSRVRVDGAAS